MHGGISGRSGGQRAKTLGRGFFADLPSTQRQRGLLPQRIGGLAPHCPLTSELPSALLRFEAVRFASLLKFSRKDPAGFIVRIFLGDAPQISAGLDRIGRSFIFCLRNHDRCRCSMPCGAAVLQGSFKVGPTPLMADSGIRHRNHRLIHAALPI